MQVGGLEMGHYRLDLHLNLRVFVCYLLHVFNRKHPKTTLAVQDLPFLHSLVLLMKMHSFAFYNGYLWGIKEELQFSKSALAKYKDSINDPKVIGALEKSCEFCSFELSSQSLSDQTQKFPNNISAKSFFGSPCFQP